MELFYIDDDSEYDVFGEPEVPVQDLLSYLSQIVLTMIDDEAKRKSGIFEEYKIKSQSMKTDVLNEKKILQEKSTELSRQKALGRVLTILKTLKNQGSLSGQTGRKISKILETLSDKDFHFLRSLEERLGAYLPDR